MAENTLSPVGFDRPFVKAHVPAESRFGLACVLGAGGYGSTEAELVRFLLTVGLEKLGWSDERLIEEYARYRVRCLHNGQLNQFER